MRAHTMRAGRLFALLLLLLLPATARAQDASDTARAWDLAGGEERILSFVSDVRIARDGELDVTETIRLVLLAQQINHGIQRDFPTIYRNAGGQRTSVGFSVVSVERDGHAEPWERMSLSNGVRIRIGSADTILPPGKHTFVIRYRTTRQIFYGKDSDELYWNATGTGWTFPIEMAEARITLPSAAPFGDRAVYTGPQGSTAHDAQVIEERPGFIAFRTTRPLGREEGLTVAASFPKGVLDAPGGGRRAAWWFEDWGALAASLLAALGIAVYYVGAWWKAGRGPKAGTIVPIFAPPDGLSPAAIRYVSRMRFDNRAFSAAMIDLGVRGKLHITQSEGGWLSKGTTTLSRTDIARPGHDGALPAPEAAMRDKLFSGGETIELKQSNHKTLQAARSALQKGLGEAYDGTMFRRNADWSVYGLFLIVLAMLGTAAIALVASPAVGLGEKVAAPLFTAILFAGAWWLGRRAARGKGALSVVGWIGAILLGLVGAVCAFGTIAAAIEAGSFAVFVPLLLLPVAISAFWWMYAPTMAGRQVMDRIAGFRQYLEITEESRLERMHPPEKTPELFERYLPYAIALDVENSWAEKFAGVLAAAAAAGTTAQTALWYTGQGNVWDDPTGFASDLGSSFSNTVASASASPSSSSGSGGGGSSGGGGGGGGGSGW